MLRPLSEPHNDNVNVIKERENNDNVNVPNQETYMWKTVLSEITEYRLNTIKNFLFGGPGGYFGDCTVLLNPALKQMERFAYVWLIELSDEARKKVATYRLRSPSDDEPRSYSDYLNSPIWKYTSGIIKMIRDYTCEECERQSNPAHLVVHHISYEHLGSEICHLEDVAVLCTDCHMKVHGVRRKDERD